MIRRDFLKLCATTVAAMAVPQVRPKYEISNTPLEIVLVSITARLIAKGTSHPDDPDDKLIEFEALQTGRVHWVIVNHLFTGERIACLTVGTEDDGCDITFNTLNVCCGDTVQITGDLKL
jgi:hypothetical protein